MRVRQRQHRRREEHGFIVRVGDQQADALVAQAWEGGARDVGGVEPAGEDEDGDEEGEVELHCRRCML